MKRLLLFPVLAVSLFAQSGGQFVLVVKPIPLSAWTLGAGSAIVTLPDGSQAIDAGYGSSFFVDLGVSPAQLQADPNHPGNPGYSIDGRYELAFDTGDTLIPYPGELEVEITFGTQQLCDHYIWGLSDVSKIVVPCDSPKYLIHQALPSGGPGQGSNDLVVTVSNPEWPLHFKKFSLRFTPQ